MEDKKKINDSQDEFEERAFRAFDNGETEYWEGLEEFYKFEESLNGKD